MQLSKRKKMMVSLLESVDFRRNVVRYAIFTQEQLSYNGIFKGPVEHVHNIATMAMLGDILTSPCM